MGSRIDIVLASASARRRRMFEEMGIPFEVVPADIDEAMAAGEAPGAYALRAAREKAGAVAETLARKGRTPWIVGADTIVVLGRDVLTKPADRAEAEAMLGRLSGREHTVITGWAVGRRGGPWISRTAETQVLFHPLSKEQVRGYAATGEGMDKAGAYAIQGIGAFLVARIDGDYFNVVGLPISLVARALIEVGAMPGFLAP
ncbi:MAG: Maf family protein [Proteobacteria bacterium]|jgi:septum formation protein|nr:Maf family protein [Pseudomonadota bacterium]